MGIRLSELLQSVPKDAEVRVDRTRKKMNAVVREAIRKETGLALNPHEAIHSPQESAKMIAVPVVLLRGLPTRLEDFEFPEDARLVATLSPYRSQLNKTKESLPDLAELIEELQRDAAGRDLVAGQGRNVAELYPWVEKLLGMLDAADPVQHILAVDEDVLGRYVYDVPGWYGADPQSGRIELYWGVIGLMARLLGVRIEALTTVVLAHELSHAHTHLGADIDHERWESQAYANSQHALKEGLAQYYTCLACQRLENQLAGVCGAFAELLLRQPAAYLTHEEWLHDYTPEEVRFALLQIRRRGVGHVSEFLEALREARTKLRREELDES